MDGIKITQYLGIPFLHLGRDRNGLDCYGLVCLFYRENFGIELPDYRYEKDWDHLGLSIIQDEYSKNFIQIDDPVKYGVVTFKNLGSRIERHIGIMIDDISFMHVPDNGGVCIEKLSHPVWSRQRGSFYRLSEKHG